MVKNKYDSLEKNKILKRIIEKDKIPIIHQLKFEFILYPFTIKYSNLVTKYSCVH